MSTHDLFQHYRSLPERAERLRFAAAHPVLFSRDFLIPLKNELDKDPARTEGELELLQELDSLRVYFAQDFTLYPAGVGPVERAAQRVENRELSV